MKATRNRDTVVIIPVYNEAQVIEQTVADVMLVFPTVVCVDDGSTDESAVHIKKTSAALVEHPINMGQGAALQTGIEYSLQDPAIKYFVTFDADGQHSVSDAKAMLDVLKEEQLDIVVGSRFLGAAVNIPRSKRLVLRLAVRFTNSFSHVKLTDTHNGLRVFNRPFALALDIRLPGMAHASEIIDKIGQGNWRYQEVPVTVTYTKYSQSKGQSSLNSVNILIDMILSRVKP